MIRRFLHPLVLAGLAVTAWTLHAASPASPTAPDWPGFRGATNGIAPALPVSDISHAQIKKLWVTPTKDGFSSFAVSNGQVFTIVERSGSETLIALDMRSGKELWSKPTAPAQYSGQGDAGTKDNRGGDGPRSTPCINDGKVYTIDRNLGVWCFNAKDGAQVWMHDVIKDNAGVNIHWDDAASPVIDGDILLLAGGGPGQGLLGLDKATGQVKWKGEDEKMTHATPIIADILGVHQCIFFTQSGLVSVEPQTGKELWRAPFKYSTSTAASPVVYEDIVYCSAGYGVGAGAFKISKSASGFSAAPLWRKEGKEANDFANHWSTPVVKDGYLYGMFSFKKFGEGPAACVDIRTGEMKWKQAGFGPGQVILSGDTVIAMSDKGEVVLFKATPSGYKELKREKLVAGKVWSYPVLAYNHIFARSTVEGGCWEIAK